MFSVFRMLSKPSGIPSNNRLFRARKGMCLCLDSNLDLYVPLKSSEQMRYPLRYHEDADC